MPLLLQLTRPAQSCKVTADGTGAERGDAQGHCIVCVPSWIKSETVGVAPNTGPPPTDALCLASGAVCDFRLSYGRVLNRKSKIIIVNRDRDEMLLNSDVFWKPQEAVQGKPSDIPTAWSPLLLASAAPGWVRPAPCPREQPV
jgi:hypothetical protein